ncbi:glycosyl hydrolase family 28-related protein [Paracoccus sp. (in: a-proteobacteria)]|uniref:glycosyl hydrolase family 28-related protein n=1 Tax=Paracoccus sp. TaxID=267 RepID=UPI0028AF179F|nr:glycosyl hydrolase family 28-related protein [Paracoccus sp. (in: a-proteobacteria)]
MASATQRITLSSGWQKIAEAKGREAMALIDAYGAVQLAIADGEPPRGDVASGHALNGSMMWPVRGAEIVWARGSGVAVAVTLLKVLPEFATLDSAAVKLAAASAKVTASAADAKATQAMQPPFTPFSSRGDAQATVIPAPLDTITITDPIYGALQYISDASGTALTTGDGRTWSPLGDAQPAHWGATGGETDSAPLFQLMLDWLSPDPNRKLVDKFVGTRYFRTQLNTTGNVVWDAGVAKYIQAHDGRFISGNGNSAPDIVAISADYVVGSTNLSVALPVIPKRGDWLRLVSNAVNPNDRSRVGQSNKYRVQEWVQAGEGSTGSNVVLIRPLRFAEGVNDAEDTVIPAYTIAMNCRVALADTSKVFRFTGGYLEQEGPFAGPVPGIFLTAYIGPVVYGTNFYKYYGSALSLSGTIDALVDRCTFGEISDNEVISGQQGYGVSDGGENTLVKECRFSKCRHGYTTLRNSIAADTLSIFASGNTVGGLVKDCHSVGSTSRHFDTHHGSVGITFEGCTAEGGSTGFGGRSYGHVVRNCHAVMTAQGFSTLVEAPNLAGSLDRYATEFTVENCAFQSLGQAFLARNSLVTLRDVTFETPLMRSFEVTNSLVTVEGNVSLSISSFRGSVPIPTPASSNPVVLATGLTLFGGAASLMIAKTGRLTLDLSALPSMPGSVLAPASGTTIKVFGTLRVAVPNGVNLMALSAARLIASPTSEFELILPSTSFGFGTAAGKFGRAYDSNGVSLLAGTMTTQAVVGGRFVEWVRDASGTCLGGGWSPAGQATPQHWGAVGDGVADDSDALEGAYMSGREIFIPAGVYRQTREVSAVHPLNVVGAGSGSAILLYENMGGYEGSNGISLQASVPSGIGTNALGSASGVRGVTVKITGQNGASWFKAPRAQANLWTRVKPTYRFDSIYFTGDNAGDAAYFELNTTAWECCIDLGEGCNHSITKITGAGNYDFRAEPTAEAVRSTFLRLGGAEAGPGGILTPELSHWWLQHFGRAIDIGWRVIRGQFHGLAIHACWQGMYSPNPRSGSNWGIDELEMSACNINVQKNAIYMRGPTGGMTFDNVDMTRATGGYDHGTGWVGMDIDNANRLSIKGGRAYSDGTTGEYSGGTTGYLLANVSNLLAGGQLIRGIGDDQMTTGMRIVNPGRGEISGLAVVGKIIDLIEFAGTPLSTGANVGITLTGIPKSTTVITGSRVKYSDGVTRALVNDLDEPQAVNTSATSISAAGSEDYTPGASPKWRRISFAAGAGAYTYDINMLAAGAREGDEVEFTFTFLAANGTVRILDSTGAVQFTKAGTTGQAWYVRGRYLGTSPALFRVMASSLNA